MLWAQAHTWGSRTGQDEQAMRAALAGAGLPSMKRIRTAPLPNLIQSIPVAHIYPRQGRQVNLGKGGSSISKWLKQISYTGSMTRTHAGDVGRARALMIAFQPLDPARSEAVTTPRTSSDVNCLADAGFELGFCFLKVKVAQPIEVPSSATVTVASNLVIWFPVVSEFQ